MRSTPWCYMLPNLLIDSIVGWQFKTTTQYHHLLVHSPSPCSGIKPQPYTQECFTLPLRLTAWVQTIVLTIICNAGHQMSIYKTDKITVNVEIRLLKHYEKCFHIILWYEIVLWSYHDVICTKRTRQVRRN